MSCSVRAVSSEAAQAGTRARAPSLPQWAPRLCRRPVGLRAGPPLDARAPGRGRGKDHVGQDDAQPQRCPDGKEKAAVAQCSLCTERDSLSPLLSPPRYRPRQGGWGGPLPWPPPRHGFIFIFLSFLCFLLFSMVSSHGSCKHLKGFREPWRYSKMIPSGGISSVLLNPVLKVFQWDSACSPAIPTGRAAGPSGSRVVWGDMESQAENP